MKKYLFVLLIAFPCLIFAQSKKDIELAIDKINIELVKGYVKQHGKSFSKEVKDWKSLYSYIKRMYPDEGHVVHGTFKNLNFSKEKYNDSESPSKFINELLDEYVQYEFDEKPIDKIIDDLVKNESKPKRDSKYTETKTINGKLKEIEEENKGKIESTKEVEKKESVPPLDKKKANPLKDKFKEQQKTADSSGKENSTNKWLYLLIGLLIGYIIKPLIKKVIAMTSEQDEHQQTRKQDLIKQRPIASIKQEEVDSSSNKVVQPIAKQPKKESPIVIKRNWLVAHTSEIGKSHLISKPPIPCQDNHAVKNLQNGWGIAISCDGAGSAKLSHKGSKFISEEALNLFESIIIKNNWIQKNELPKKENWELLARKALKKLRYDLEQLAKFENVDSKDLACTIIVVIYSPIGLLTTHIGDGRAGYRNQENIWKPIISPHKGDEANQTIFITSDPWLNENFVMSGLKVPESNVINDSPSAFTLMSDGCETHSFEMGYFDKEKQKFVEQNNPYPKFFEPLIHTLLNMKKEGLTGEEINQKWSGFVNAGTDKLKNEPDDKTLIIGVLTN